MVVSAALPGPPLVGREDELSILTRFLSADGNGPTGLLLEGPAGIGKTLVMRTVLERARPQKGRVLVASPASVESELPYAGLTDLLAAEADEAALGALLPPQREAIEVALGRAGGLLNEHLVARGLLELLRHWCRDGAIVVVIDDVQWLDQPTASALAFAFRRLGALPLRLLLGLRREDGTEPQLPLGLAAWTDVQRIALGPLSVTELGVLVSGRLGRNLARPRLEALWRETGGNPMFALELAEQGSGQRPKGTTLHGAVGERLRILDPEARIALSYAAVAFRPSPELLLRAGLARGALRAALDSGVLEVDDDRLRFVHPLFATVAYESLLPDERREIHGRLAAASIDLVERGHHVSRATVEPDGSAAETLASAAEEAAARGDRAGAAALLLRAVELSPDPASELASGWEVQAAGELLQAGDVAAAATLCRGMIDRLGAGVLRARTRQLLFHATAGPEMSYEDALAEMSAALEDAADDPATLAELHVEMSEIAAGMCWLDRSVAHAQAAVTLAEHADADSTATAALAVLGFAQSMLGQGVPAAAREAFARWDGAIHASNSPRMLLACECLAATRFSEAEALFTDELAMTQELAIEAFEVVARGHLAETQLRAGHWGEALGNARLAVEHAHQAAEPQVIVGTSHTLATAWALIGRHDDARELATEGLVAAEATRDFWFTVSYRALLGLIALTDDDPGQAAEILQPAWDLMRERRLGDLALFPVANVLGEALVALGRLDDALAVAAHLEACPVGGDPWCRVMTNRLLALVASSSGDHAGARQAIIAAIDAHGELAEPFEHARTLHLAGRIERHARSWGAARAMFAEALERFDQLGAARWSEKIAEDLSRLPGRRPADPLELSVREREVAELVAGGLANKEVAARLFISVSTVETALSRAYVKLGVRSRTELAARLSHIEAARLSADSTD
jgi:DNA-binding CsgD family transcriptional regulator